MSETPFRIPLTEAYAEALGRAVYSFCYLEWEVVWIIECLEPGFVNEVTGLTAGQIANRFIDETNKPHALEATLALRLSDFAECFKRLVDSRNALVHGNPYTAENGEQRLGYSGKRGRVEWPLSEIVSVTSKFEQAALEAGHILHGSLLTKT